MPRQARIDVAGCLYHVMERGIERRKIFLKSGDYKDFLSRLEAGLDKTGSKCLAWCLMPNHFHLLVLRGERPLAELMRRVMTGYAVGFNIRYRRSGHLFQNRYKAVLCDADEYLLELVAYIHLNPARAKIVRGMAGLKKYPWSGHKALVGEGKAGFIAREQVLRHFGSSLRSAMKKYEEFVEERIGKYKRGEYSGGGLIRSIGGKEAALSLIRGGEKEAFDERVLGDGDFVERILKMEGQTRSEVMPREEIIREVERRTGIKSDKIFSASRERAVSAARALYCCLRKEKGRASGVELMKELKISCGGVAMLVQRGRVWK